MLLGPCIKTQILLFHLLVIVRVQGFTSGGAKGRVLLQLNGSSSRHQIGAQPAFGLNIGVAQLAQAQLLMPEDKQPTSGNTGVHTSTQHDPVAAAGISSSSAAAMAPRRIITEAAAPSPFALQHTSSGRCVHPLGGFANPLDGTNLQFYITCDEPELQWLLTPSGALQHVMSGKCLQPYGGASPTVAGSYLETQLMLADGCEGAHVLWRWTAGGQLQHVDSQMCVQAYQNIFGSVTGPSQLLVLNPDCTSDILQIHRRAMNVPVSSFAPALPSSLCGSSSGGIAAAGSLVGRNFSLGHVDSGWCVHPYGGASNPARGTNVILYPACNEPRLQFQWTTNKALQHVTSGSCLLPATDCLQPATNTALVLGYVCNTSQAQFQWTSNGALQHVASRLCVTTYPNPVAGLDTTPLVLSSSCSQAQLKPLTSGILAGSNNDISIRADTKKYLASFHINSNPPESTDYAIVHRSDTPTTSERTIWTLVQQDKTTVGFRASYPPDAMLTRCSSCAASNGADFPDVVAVRIPDQTSGLKDANASHWTLVSLGKKDTYGVRADNGLYMARCQGCQTLDRTSTEALNTVFVYVREVDLLRKMEAQWYIPNVPAWAHIEDVPQSLRNPPVSPILDSNVTSFIDSALAIINEFLGIKDKTQAYRIFLALYNDNVPGTDGDLATFLTYLNITKVALIKAQAKKGKNVKMTTNKSNKNAAGRAKILSIKVLPTKKKPAGRRRSILYEEELLAAELGSAAATLYHSMLQDNQLTGNGTILFGPYRGLKQQGAAAPVPDWSYVLPEVQDQGNCGACWAFVMTGLMEAAHYINTGEYIALSASEVLDCSVGATCATGAFSNAYDYIKKYGLGTAAAYRGGKYAAKKQACLVPTKPLRTTGVSKVQNATILMPNEASMLLALARGPIGAAVWAEDGWLDYAGGVYTSTTCKPKVAGQVFNHAVIIVGAGIDEVTGLPYWRIRNSWGTKWGEGGYMRLLRGKGLCNIHLDAWQLQSADLTTSTPAQGSATCKPTQVPLGSGPTALIDLAKQYGTTMSQIQIDNQIYYNDNVQAGQMLDITCPSGNWSPPFALDPDVAPLLAAAPTVAICPPGTYAVSIYAKPSSKPAITPYAMTYIGTLRMTCSDGTQLQMDAHPDFDAFEGGDGHLTNMNGFNNLTFYSDYMLASIAGVGAVGYFNKNTWTCGPKQLITGFAAGALDWYYPESYIINFQLQCNNPFATTTRTMQSVAALRNGVTFPFFQTGVTCQSYTVVAGDTWLSVAQKLKVTSLNELVRVNPHISGALKVGNKLFKPPCNKGQLPGTSTLPAQTCKTRLFNFDGKMSLPAIARRFNTTVSRIMLDNKLDFQHIPQLQQKLTITCPAATGQWSPPFANLQLTPGMTPLSMTAAPTMAICPPNTYAVSMSVKTSNWPELNRGTSDTLIGTITMGCSNGVNVTADAQPGFTPMNAGTATKYNSSGLTSIGHFNQYDALDTLLQVGLQSGAGWDSWWDCPKGTVLTGFSASARGDYYPQSYLVYFQVQCSFVKGWPAK